jgi:hypothetical protein
MHYTVSSLHDGTVLSAYPIRKPVPKTMKRERLRIDEDGVCHEYARAGKELRDVCNESRMRFQNIIATRLNTRRAIREMVVPHLVKLQADVEEMCRRLERIEGLLTSQETRT